MWWESHNPVYGFTCNPYDLRCIVGGSSGGEVSLEKITDPVLSVFIVNLFCEFKVMVMLYVSFKLS